MVRAVPGSSNLISSFFSFSVTDTPWPSGRLNEPLAPLMVIWLPAMVAVTPEGRSTGALAILDMMLPSLSFASGHDAEHFAALPACARLLVGHDALGRRDD